MGNVFHSFDCPGSAAFGVDVLLAGAEGGWGGAFCGPDDAAPFLYVFNPSAAEEHIHPSPPLDDSASPPSHSLRPLTHCMSSKYVFSWPVIGHPSEAKQPECFELVSQYMTFFSPSFQALPSSPYINKFVPSLLLCRRCKAPPFPSVCETFCHPVSSSRSSSPPSRSFILPVLAGAAVDLRVVPAAWKGKSGGILASLPNGRSSSSRNNISFFQIDIFSFLFESGGDQSANIHSFSLFLLFFNLLY